MRKVKRLGVLSFAKFQGVMGLLVGLVLGVVYSIGGLLMDALVGLGWITSQETPGLSWGTVLAFGALVGMPIIFALGGFLLGLIESLLYNLFTPIFGGLKVEFE